MVGLVEQARLVAQSVMSATDTLGHRDVHGLSVTDPCPRYWISIGTIPKDVGMCFITSVFNHPLHVCVGILHHLLVMTVLLLLD